MNVFILTVDYDRDAFVQALDLTPMVRNWLAFLPNAVAITTHRPLQQISDYLRVSLPGHQFILVPATSTTSAGLMPANVWDFINKPFDSGRHLPDSWPGGLNSLTGLMSGLPKPPSKPDIPHNDLTSRLLGDKDEPRKT